MKQKREIAQSEARDKTVKLIAGLLPYGSSAYELITTLVVPLHEKKRWEFINDMAIRIQKLEDFEKLAQNEEFNTIITKAILLAQQNHQKEKLEALRNIVLNSIEWLNNNEPIFDWSHKFLMIVDQISPLHMLLLKTFRNPAKIAKEEGLNFDGRASVTVNEVFFSIYPDLKDRAALANQCWKELRGYGFVGNNLDEAFGVNGMGAALNNGRLTPQTTDFGNKFLDMISSEE